MQTLLHALSSDKIALLIRSAQERVVYAAPGIREPAAEALAQLAGDSPSPSITVTLDFCEETLRMGYGDLSAVDTLRAAGIKPTRSPGFRSAILIVDGKGWIFTPTALYLEDEPHSEETPNAVTLTKQQLDELLLRLCPVARQKAIERADSPTEAARLESTSLRLFLTCVPSRRMAVCLA